MNTITHEQRMAMCKLRPLPYFIAGFGLFIAIFSYYFTQKLEYIGTISTRLSLSALLFISITLLSLFLATLTAFIQMRTVRNQLLNTINLNFEKEKHDRNSRQETHQKLEKALLQGQKLQAIGNLAGGIAHDFNNLLYAIIGYVEMACEDSPENSLIYQNLTKVLEAAHRGQDLIARILIFSRRQHHEFHAIDLQKTIESVLDLLKPTIPASVLIHFNVSTPDNYKIMGNQTQLHQVLVNLINNAVDAMDSEGAVNITLSRLSTNEKLLEQLPKTFGSHYFKIDVSDTGHGMDSKTIERIFEPFFTTKEVGKGTGLGLATVHAIIEEHQGENIVTSQLGKGTTFTILLPEYNAVDQEINHGKNFIS